MNIQHNTQTPGSGQSVKVMLVEDSAAIRAIIKQILRGCPEIELTGTACDGRQAVDNVERLDPDVIILDIEMPVMDGIAALPLLLEKKKNAKVIICSTLSDHGADISLKALSMGASECILKPTGADALRGNNSFSETLIRTVLSLGREKIRRKTGLPATPVEIKYAPSKLTSKPGILAIGSSTGGPNALLKVLSGLNNLGVPIVITQHMPPKFTKLLADQIAKVTGIECFEGENGMKIRDNCIYVAPGGYHMLLVKEGMETVIKLSEEPPENFCRPSVDPMLRSLIKLYGSRIYTVILTGMGNDGLIGSKQVVEAGGHVIAQDEASSVVWGMPKAVAEAGICSAILPDEKITAHILDVFKK